uniref:Thioredoxin domain-containing protein 17 n=1 Tax=Ditylenchus dipsaci TaxID=166011 RepID=A0A915DER7_9BILA
MVVNNIAVDGYENLINRIKELNIVEGGRHPQFVFFIGSKLPETGESWCPDCVKAEPVMNEALKDARLTTYSRIDFVTCSVGLRD